MFSKLDGLTPFLAPLLPAPDLPRILYRSSSQADSRFPLLSGGGHAPAAQPAGLAARGTALMPDLRRDITR